MEVSKTLRESVSKRGNERRVWSSWGEWQCRQAISTIKTIDLVVFIASWMGGCGGIAEILGDSGRRVSPLHHHFQVENRVCIWYSQAVKFTVLLTNK